MDERFIQLLNRAAFGILIGILIVLGYLCISSIYQSNRTLKVIYGSSILLRELNVKDSLVIASNKEVITRMKTLVDSLGTKIKEIERLKQQIDDSDKKNEDTYRLILTLIGAVFAIVGFFGFRSIFEMRNHAVEQAILSANKAAEKIAKEAVVSEFPEFFKKAKLTYEQSLDVLKEDFSKLEDRISNIEVRNNQANESEAPNLQTETEIKDESNSEKSPFNDEEGH